MRHSDSFQSGLCSYTITKVQFQVALSLMTGNLTAERLNLQLHAPPDFSHRSYVMSRMSGLCFCSPRCPPAQGRPSPCCHSSPHTSWHTQRSGSWCIAHALSQRWRRSSKNSKSLWTTEPGTRPCVAHSWHQLGGLNTCVGVILVHIAGPGIVHKRPRHHSWQQPTTLGLMS